MTSLAEKRLVNYTKSLIDFYMLNPDSKIHSKFYVELLAQCMAKKIIYGVSYPPHIESQLTLLNYGAGRRTLS